MSPTSSTIKVEAPRVETRGSITRVSALVDGVDLWFESSDIELRPSAEAFASALLLASVHRGRSLAVNAALSEQWLANTEQLFEFWNRWWGYEPRTPIAERAADAPAHSSVTALMFSAGVDSYHSLLGGADPDMLVSVHGFDIPLSDTERIKGLKSALLATAEAHNKRPVFIRTNLRDHPSVGRPHLWERSHGGGLAAIGHLMSNDIGRLVISASWYTPDEQPWGSHSQTDHFFSANGLRVHHFGNETRREEKVALVASDPVASKHIRVCYKNVPPAANCSRCEKCVVTMMHLMENGVLREFDAFDGNDLAKRVAALPYIHYYYNISRRLLARGRLDPAVQKELATVLGRSRRAHAFLRLKSRVRQAFDRYV